MQDRFKFRLYDDIHREMIDLQEQDVNPYNISDIPQNNIMQCTGLKDKNGKLIYEDDIVDTRQGRMVIKFDEYRAMFCMISPIKEHSETPLYNADYANRLEVIGNIYENTELLEVHHV